MLYLLYNSCHPLRLLRLRPSLKYRIAVARLDGDEGDQLRRNILSALEEAAATLDIELVSLPKVLLSRGSNRQAQVERLHERARKFLRSVHADVLIWGEANSAGLASLRWTPIRKPDPPIRRYPSLHPLVFSKLLRDDVVQVIGLLAVSATLPQHRASIRDLSTLKERVAKARALLAAPASLSPETHASLLFAAAEGCISLGLLLGDVASFLEACKLLCELKKIWTADVNLEWHCGISINLGNARAEMGSLTGSVEDYALAREAYHDAVRLATGPELVALAWQARENLLIAEVELGQLSRDCSTAKASLEEAILKLAADRASLKPAQIAHVQSTIGFAQGLIGSCTAEEQLLSESVATLGQLAAESGAALSRQELARVHTNRGIALRYLGEARADRVLFCDSIAAHRLAVSMSQRSTHPLAWAECMNNLANSLALWGSLDGSTAALEEAIGCYTAVLEVRDKVAVPIPWAKASNNVGIAYRMLFEILASPQLLVAAIRAHLEAWSVLSSQGHAFAEMIAFNLALDFSAGMRLGCLEAVLRDQNIDRDALTRLEEFWHKRPNAR